MLIYRSFYDAIKELPLEEQGQIWKAVFELGLNNNELELSGIPKVVFTLIRPQIEANIRRFQNGTKPKLKQTESKPEANKNININSNIENNNTIRELNDRKLTFYKSLAQFVKQYPKEMLRDFYEYWSEHGDKDKKMRFEKEKSFGIERRLKTWEKNQTKFGTQKTAEPTQDKLVDFVNQQLGK
jgi:hypothetical protein